MGLPGTQVAQFSAARMVLFSERRRGLRVKEMGTAMSAALRSLTILWTIRTGDHAVYPRKKRTSVKLVSTMPGLIGSCFLQNGRTTVRTEPHS